MCVYVLTKLVNMEHKFNVICRNCWDDLNAHDTAHFLRHNKMLWNVRLTVVNWQLTKMVETMQTRRNKREKCKSMAENHQLACIDSRTLLNSKNTS